MTETHAPCAIILGPSARRADERHGASRSPQHPRGRLHPLRCVRFLRPIDRKQRPEQPTVHASSRTDQHAPTGTPEAVITKLNAEINRILATPALQERISALGGVPAPMTPAQFAAKAAEDSKRFGAIIRERQIVGN